MDEQKEIKKKNFLAENWNRVDETCQHCGQVTKRVRGITKQNLKRLITPRFDLNELLITFFLIMVLLLAWAYKNETAQCRDWINPMFESDKQNCLNVCNNKCEMIQGIPIKSNSSQQSFQINMSLLDGMIVNEQNELNETNATKVS